MSTFERFELGKKPLGYVKEQLSYGGPLARDVQNLLNLEAMVFETHLLSGTTNEQLDNYPFSAGVTIAGGYSAVTHAVLHFVSELQKPAKVIFETQHHDGDPALEQGYESHFIYKMRANAYLAMGGADFDTVLEFIRFGGFYPAIGIITTYTHELQDKSHLSERKVHELVGETQLLLIGSYDNESWLIGRK